MLKLMSRFVLEVLPYLLSALIAAIVVPGFLNSQFHGTRPERRRSRHREHGERPRIGAPRPCGLCAKARVIGPVLKRSTAPVTGKIGDPHVAPLAYGYPSLFRNLQLASFRPGVKVCFLTRSTMSWRPMKKLSVSTSGWACSSVFGGL